MNLLVSWKESLSIFYSWQSFKSFAVDLIRELGVAILSFVVRFWWLMVWMVVMAKWALSKPGNSGMGALLISLPILIGIFCFLPMAACFPLWRKKSVEKSSYFSWLILPVVYFVYVLLIGFVIFSVDLESHRQISTLSPMIWTFLVTLFFSLMILLPIWTLFFYDTKKTFFDFFHSIGRSFLIILFNAPVWIIFVAPLVLSMHFVLANDIVKILEKLIQAPWDQSSNVVMSNLTVLAGVLVGGCLYNLLYTSFWSVLYARRMNK